MPRSTLTTVAYPFLYALPRGRRYPVAAAFEESPDGGTRVWLTAAGYLPEYPQAYFEQENADTPCFHEAMRNAVACYVHDEDGHTTAYRVPARTLDVHRKAPSFMPPAGFSRGAFTCCFNISGRPEHRQAEWRYVAAHLPEGAGFDLYLTNRDGTTTELPRVPFAPAEARTYDADISYGKLRIRTLTHLFADSEQTPKGNDFNAGGIPTKLNLPTLQLLGSSTCHGYVSVRVEAPFGSPIANAYWTGDEYDDYGQDELDGSDLDVSVLEALQEHVKQEKLRLTHESWSELHRFLPEERFQPKPFYYPWQPDTRPYPDPEHRNWPQPQPLPGGQAYRVNLESAADQHLLALAWEDSMPGTLLVHDHPEMRGYPWFEKLPVIGRMTFVLEDDPDTVHETDDGKGEGAIRFTTHPEITVHAHVTLQGKEFMLLALKARVAFKGDVGDAPLWQVFLAEGNPPDPKTLIRVLVQSYFKTSDEHETQYRNYHLATLSRVYAQLRGADDAYRHLVQTVFEDSVFPFADERPALISVEFPHVRVYRPVQPK